MAGVALPAVGVDETAEAPPAVRLLATPNPFSRRAVFRLELPATRRVVLELFDLSGRRVGSGVYFYRLAAGREVATGRIVRIR